MTMNSSSASHHTMMMLKRAAPGFSETCHIAAKIYLDRNPGDYATVQQVLGHKSLNTTTSIYTGMETRAAGRHFVDVVRGRQSGSRS